MFDFVILKSGIRMTVTKEARELFDELHLELSCVVNLLFVCFYVVYV